MAVALSPDGKLAVSGGDDHTLRFWNCANGKPIRKLQMRPWVGGMRFSPDGKLLATTAVDSVRFWDPARRKEIHKRFAVKQPGYGLAFSPDGSKLAVVAGASVQVWDMQLGKKLHDFAFDRTSVWRAWKVAFSPRGNLLAVALHSRGGERDGIAESPLVRVLELSSGKEIFTAWAHGAVNDVAFSPNGRLLAAGGTLSEGGRNDGVLQVWELATKRRVYKVEADRHTLFCLAFSPDGKTIACGGNDSAITLWNALLGQPIRKLEGHSDQVHDLAFSANGKLLASAGRDRLVLLWQLDKLGQKAAAVKGD
jgi:WD40 repeat protein